MTLATRVIIRQPVNPEPLFEFLIDLLASEKDFTPAWLNPDRDPNSPFDVRPGPIQRPTGATYTHGRKGDPVIRSDGTTVILRDGKPMLHTIDNYRSTVGQGLPAMLVVEYGADGPLVPDEDYFEPGEPAFNASGDEGHPFLDGYAIDVDFDTAYSYTSEAGAGCSDLHAFLVAVVYGYLAALPGDFDVAWQNEYTGRWYLSVLELGVLGDPLKGGVGFKAVMPS